MICLRSSYSSLFFGNRGKIKQKKKERTPFVLLVHVCLLKLFTCVLTAEYCVLCILFPLLTLKGSLHFTRSETMTDDTRSVRTPLVVTLAELRRFCPARQSNTSHACHRREETHLCLPATVSPMSAPAADLPANARCRARRASVRFVVV